MSNFRKAFVYIFEPNKILLFSIVTSFVGYTYMGREESSSYIYVMTAMFLIAFAFYCKEIIKQRYINSKAFSIITFWIMWLTINLIMFLLKFGWDYAYTKYYIFFFVFSFNSLLWGIMFGKDYTNNIKFLIKYFEPICCVIAVFSIVYVLLPFGGIDSTIRRAAYQSNSYYSAFAFGMILFYLTSGRAYERFKIFTSMVFKLIYICLLILLPLAVISTGGRGGFVLIIIYAFITLRYIFLNGLQTKDLLKKAGMLIGFIVLVVLVVIIVSGNNNFKNSFDVITSYLDFSSGRINMGATSNRDKVYVQALELIKQKPILGHGVFLSMPLLTTTYSYPHQLFLEFMLQGGIIYTVICCCILIRVFSKLRFLQKIDNRYTFIQYMFAYPFIMLMFSGSYLTTSLFWFCIAVILSAGYKDGTV